MTTVSKQLCFGVVAFASLVAALPYVQCLGDDTFIYMRLIERWMETGRFEYNHGEACYGMTSVTWFFAWAWGTRLLGNMEVARYALSAIFHLLAFTGVYLVGQRLITHAGWVGVALIAVFFDPFYLRWFWAGWEMSPKIAAAAFVILGLIRLEGRDRPLAASVQAGVIAGLGILTRPELMLLALLGIPYVIFRVRHRRISSLLGYIVGIAVIALPWMLYAHHVFGWWIPHTVFAKTGAPLSAEYLRHAIPKMLSIVFLPALPLYIAALLASLSARSAFSDLFTGHHTGKARERTTDWMLVTSWGMALFGYIVTGSYIESIKTGLFTPFLLLAAASILSGARRHPSGHPDRVAPALLGILLLLFSFGLQAKLYYRFAIWNPRYRGGEDAHFIRFARTIREQTKPTDRIGLWELGVIGYYSERYIVDFVGLATPDIVRSKMENADGYVERHLREHGGWPEYIADAIPSSRLAELDLPERRFFGRDYRPVFFEDVQRIGGREQAGHFYRYTLYRRAD